MQTVRHQPVENSARWAFWGFMAAVALTVVSVSLSTLPSLLLWIATVGVAVTGAKFVIAIVRMPQGARTLWSLVGAWGLLVAVLSLTI